MEGADRGKRLFAAVDRRSRLLVSSVSLGRGKQGCGVCSKACAKQLRGGSSVRQRRKTDTKIVGERYRRVRASAKRESSFWCAQHRPVVQQDAHNAPDRRAVFVADRKALLVVDCPLQAMVFSMTMVMIAMAFAVCMIASMAPELAGKVAAAALASSDIIWL